MMGPGPSGRAIAKRAVKRKSRFFGVSCNRKGRGCWYAKLRVNGKMEHLGTFALNEEVAAARVFDDAARAARGVHAHGGMDGNGKRSYRLNFPTEEEEQRLALLFASGSE